MLRHLTSELARRYGRPTATDEEVSSARMENAVTTSCHSVDMPFKWGVGELLYRPLMDAQVFEAARAASIHDAIMTRFPQVRHELCASRPETPADAF